MVFSRASRPAFTITTNGETGILQPVQKILVLLCATSVSSVSPWLSIVGKHSPQRHREHRVCTEKKFGRLCDNVGASMSDVSGPMKPFCFIAGCALACLLLVPAAAQEPVVVQPGAPGQPTKTLPATTRPTLPPVSPADVQFMQGMIMHHAQ